MELLRKDAFQWRTEANKAFEDLKSAMTTAPMLALPDMIETFTIKTDASNIGIRVVLMQWGHPMEFVSNGLSARQ